MSSIKATAHRAGALYFVFMIAAIIGEYFFPAFMVPGDAAATTRNIAAALPAYRMSILTGFVTLILFIFLVESLYRLLEGADRGQAMLMVLLVSIGVAVALANLLLRFAPLVLVSDAGSLTGFTQPQRDALTLGVLRFHSKGAAIPMTFWGLWLFPFGLLVIKSRFLPRILGVLLMIAGIGYLTTGVTSIAWPEYRSTVSRLMMPLYFGEVPIVFWLLIMGARASQPGARLPEGAR